MASVTVYIKDVHLEAAAIEAGVAPYQYIARLRRMYVANLHEDLKWVIEDIQETGV